MPFPFALAWLNAIRAVRHSHTRAQGHNIFTSRRAIAMTTLITATKLTRLTTKPCTLRHKTAMMSTITATKSTKSTMKPRTSRCEMGKVDKALCASARHAGCVAQQQQQWGLVHLRTTCWSRCTMATTIWHRAQAHGMPVASHDGDDDMASCASAGHVSYVTQWWQQQGLVRKRTTCRLRRMMATATTSAATKTTKSTSTTIPCAQAHQAFSHRAQAHELQRQT